MTVLDVSPADRSAYAKIGGAIDNISDAYPYAAKAISTADENRLDPLSNSGRVSKYLKVSGYVQKAYSYYSKIKDVFSEKKRDGAILKLGVKIAMDVAGKLLGKSLTTHPYYAYHKAQIEALADALNAHRNAKEAIEAYKRAVKAADSKALEAEFKRIASRKVDISAHFSDLQKELGMAYDIARGMGSPQYLKKQLADYGSDKLQAAVDDFEGWRAAWAGLAFDALQLQIMAANELKVAREAMAEVQDLMVTLLGGSNTSRVMGYGAYNQIQWEQYEQIVQGGRPDLMMKDPAKFAEGNLAKAEEWGRAFSEMCDFARTYEAQFKGAYNQQLMKLNKVLYG